MLPQVVELLKKALNLMLSTILTKSGDLDTHITAEQRRFILAKSKVRPSGGPLLSTNTIGDLAHIFHRPSTW